MPILLHINGPSGVGKSTLARRWSDDRPGSLDLEADHLSAMLGGWQADFGAAFTATRRLALAMAATHLSEGFDVVMPQLVTLPSEAERFERVAQDACARYVEVALLAEPDMQIERFRQKSGSSDIDRLIGEYIDDRGGDSVLRRIQGHLLAYLDQRPNTGRLATDDLDVGETYDALLRLVPTATGRS